ncbi:hypothetical protein ACWEOA_20670 [Streptomyces sp. NPDC004457]
MTANEAQGQFTRLRYRLEQRGVAHIPAAKINDIVVTGRPGLCWIGRNASTLRTASSRSAPRRWPPVRYAQQPHVFPRRQDDLNEVLGGPAG